MARQSESNKKPDTSRLADSGFLRFNAAPRNLTYSQKIQHLTAAAWLPYLTGMDLEIPCHFSNDATDQNQ